MAFLLLLHEKMRLKRKVNTMTLRQVRVSHRKERMTKKIAQVQKMYANRLTQLEKQASIWTKQAQMSIYNGFGLGTQNQLFNPMSAMSGGSMLNSCFMNALGGILGGLKDSSDAPKGAKDANYKDIMNAYMSNDLKPNYKKGADGKETSDIESYGSGKFDVDAVKAFQAAYQQAGQYQQYAQWQAQQMSSMYESNVSVWVEAQRMAIEEEQEKMLLPLQAEEEDLDLENESLEAQLQDARARLESLEQACSQEIKDSVPKFGLG